MREIIPFKKDILFKTRINEITNITLEHDYKILSDIVEGNFMLSGSYKMTEASVVNEDFFYKIPFSIAITKDIKRETLELNIKDFAYEIKDADELSISVDMMLTCEECEVEPVLEREEIIEEVPIKEVEEIEEEKPLEDIIDEVIEEEMKNEKREIEEKNTEEYQEKDTRKKQKKEENKIQEEKIEEISEKELIISKQKEMASEKEMDSIIESVKEKNDYVTYKVYLAKENETVESICAKYNVEEKEVRKYNNTENINQGDKIIIPFVFNE